jgi:hypothetical protein
MIFKYFSMGRPRKLLIIGPILPPVGGISIHIDRFVNLFSDEFSFDYIDEARVRKAGIFNLRSFNLIRYFKKISSADIIFIHSVKNIQRYFHLIAGKLTKAKIIFSVHTYPKALGFPIGFLDRYIFNLADRIILVNQHMKSFLRFSDNKIFIKHAFLPPVLEKEGYRPECYRPYAQSTAEFVAATWRRDSRKYQLHNNLTAADLTVQGEAAATDGLEIRDLARDGLGRWSALWVATKGNEGEIRCYVDLPYQVHAERLEAWPKDGFYIERLDIHDFGHRTINLKPVAIHDADQIVELVPGFLCLLQLVVKAGEEIQVLIDGAFQAAGVFGVGFEEFADVEVFLAGPRIFDKLLDAVDLQPQILPQVFFLLRQLGDLFARRRQRLAQIGHEGRRFAARRPERSRRPVRAAAPDEPRRDQRSRN